MEAHLDRPTPDIPPVERNSIKKRKHDKKIARIHRRQQRKHRLKTIKKQKGQNVFQISPYWIPFIIGIPLFLTSLGFWLWGGTALLLTIGFWGAIILGIALFLYLLVVLTLTFLPKIKYFNRVIFFAGMVVVLFGALWILGLIFSLGILALVGMWGFFILLGILAIVGLVWLIVNLIYGVF